MPYQRQYRQNHSLVGSGSWLEAHQEFFPFRHSLERNQRSLYPDPRVIRAQSAPSGFRCNASQPHGHHRLSRSYPDHQSVDNASRTAAPNERSYRRPPNHHAGDIYQSHHQQHVLTFCTLRSSCYLTHFAQKALDGERV